MLYIPAQELKAIAQCASKNKSRPILCAVAIFDNGPYSDDEYTLVSTDSFLMGVIQNGTLRAGQKPLHIVEADCCKSLKASDVTVELETKDEYFVQARIIDKRNNTRIEYWPTVEGSYPNILQLLEDRPDSQTATLDPAKLATITKVFTTANKGGFMTIQTQPSKPSQFSTKTENGHIIHCILMPIRVNSESPKTYMPNIDKTPAAA